MKSRKRTSDGVNCQRHRWTTRVRVVRRHKEAAQLSVVFMAFASSTIVPRSLFTTLHACGGGRTGITVRGDTATALAA
eukprot:3649849-Prymnesium_polylepis.1